jgi:transmembrane sensor
VRDLESYLRRRRRRRLALTGVAFAVAGLGVGLRWVPRAVVSEPPAVAETRTLVLRPGTHTLADGTVVELKDDARIVADFTGALRRVALQRGEAHFQVAKDPARPFVVGAAGVEVRAVGTAFSVQLGAADVDVVVTEGTVAIERGGETAGRAAPAADLPRAEPAALVTAGHQVVVALTGGPAGPVVRAITPEAVDRRLAWRRLRLDFSDTPLSDVVRMFNAASRGPARLVLAEPALGSLQISGILRADNTESLLRLLEKEFGIEAAPSGDAVVLRRARPKSDR